MARKKKEECPSVPGWLVSFGDLMSLLLTFFILLYSMSTISLEKFYQSIRGLTEAFGGRTLQNKETIIQGKKVNLNFPMYPKIKKKKAVQKKLNDIKQMLENAGFKAEVVSHGSTITLRLFSDKIFPPGKDIPYKDVIPYIMTFCEKLKDSSLPLIIVGHTDNTPIKSKRFSNNLELSASRAVNILRMFIKCGYDEKALAAEGRGEFEPIVPNDTPQNRAKNRRIEFVIDLSV
ncbi:OmpA/MotB family protein [Nitrosophilus kaiyonis]|uniref:OmpA/MotB family protein n=1 Tax=Nitrosophilus kaiyonis TaxID=2930200 RepID=UPI0024913FEA|nr:flagellar motor protein MotB [Nitrosophilus kaiyonis]